MYVCMYVCTVCGCKNAEFEIDPLSQSVPVQSSLVYSLAHYFSGLKYERY